MNLPFFLAKHIYRGGESQRVSRPAIKIATAGVAIGLAVMLVSVSIVLGFKHTIRDKVIGFGGHITVSNFSSLHSREQAPIAMTDSMMNVLRKIDGVKHVQRYAAIQGILKTDSDFLGVMFKGISSDYDTTFIHQNMIKGSIPLFSDRKSSNRILISKIMADALRLKIGDRVYAYFINNNDVRTRRFTISGIYQTNLTQFDKAICFFDMYTTIRLNNWKEDQASGAEITVCDFNKIDAVEDIIVNKVNRTTDAYGETYSSGTIQENNPQIFSWLDLLDLNVWIILILMLCVAGFTMISGLLIIILERTSMIGLLKSLGAKNSTVRHTFLWFSIFIVGRGMIIGNVLGLGLIFIQYFTGLIKLDPATYYVSTVPVEINVPLFLLINIATLMINVLVLVAPSYLVSHISPAKSMRYE